MKRYPLAVSRDYVRHWKLHEAVRELLQNALDSDSPFEYSFEGDTLTITSRYASLSPRTLLLGVTTKADRADTIGSFGEGYKLALLVLLREGYPVIVRNGAKIWTPVFEYSEDYGAEVMVINETDADSDCQAVEFVIMGIDEAQQREIRSHCLLMQPPMHNVIAVGQGNILPDRPGQLFVGGLFVCTLGRMAYGYDIKPEFIQLERDRQTVKTWEVEVEIARMWLVTEQWELIARLMADGTHDVEDIRLLPLPTGLADACAKEWIKTHGDAIPVVSQQEANDRQQAATSPVETVFTGVNLQRAVMASTLIAHTAIARPAPLSPRQQVEQWFNENKNKMPRVPKVAFKRLHEASANWRLS
ncbi:hypothetical protein BJP27_24040 (plasmid) [Pseudomonas oryzihabitans]|nr:hypothetical protein BJP27_24040 [Pseudomonas psychrotolerans]